MQDGRLASRALLRQVMLVRHLSHAYYSSKKRKHFIMLYRFNFKIYYY